MKSFGRIVALALACAVLFALGFSWRDLEKGQPPKLDRLAGTPKLSGLAIFEQAYSQIAKSSWRPVDKKKLKYAALEGMMASLGDPHTVFLEPRDAEQLALETRGDYAGIGCRLSPDPIGARIEVVFEGSPAKRAGLQVGDTISGVEGKSTLGQDIDEIVSKIRGPEGTMVKLQIQRTGQAKPTTVSVGRARIETPTVQGAMVKGSQVGRLVVSGFAENTPEQFVHELTLLENKHIKGLVIDLRGNPGGLLESAAALMGLFVDDKVVVKMRNREGNEEVVKSLPGIKRKFGYPIVCLIDEDSASAAEIFSGCLRDYGFAKLVGDHSYGKASVQSLRMMRDGASVKITTDRYYLPTTPDISRKVDEDGVYVSGGLQPDVKISLDPETEVLFGDPASDLQLKKALEVLNSG